MMKSLTAWAVLLSLVLTAGVSFACGDGKDKEGDHKRGMDLSFGNDDDHDHDHKNKDDDKDHGHGH